MSVYRSSRREEMETETTSRTPRCRNLRDNKLLSQELKKTLEFLKVLRSEAKYKSTTKGPSRDLN